MLALNRWVYVGSWANDEVVAVVAPSSRGEAAVLVPEGGVGLPEYFGTFVRGRYRVGNGALRMQEPKTHGPCASGLRLRSSTLSYRPP